MSSLLPCRFFPAKFMYHSFHTFVFWVVFFGKSCCFLCTFHNLWYILLDIGLVLHIHFLIVISQAIHRPKRFLEFSRFLFYIITVSCFVVIYFYWFIFVLSRFSGVVCIVCIIVGLSVQKRSGSISSLEGSLWCCGKCVDTHLCRPVYIQV